jgi:hypothetical protein
MFDSMWLRLKTFRRNAGLLNAAGLTTVALLFTLGTVGVLISDKPLRPLVCFWPMVAISWLLRGAIIHHARAVAKVLPVGWVLIIVNVFLRPTAGWFPGDDWVMFSFVGAYCGTMFWLWSDPRIVRL